MKKNNVIEYTFLFVIPFSIIAGLVLYLISKDFGLLVSYALGTLASMMMQSFNYRIMKATFKNHPEKIQRRTIYIYIAKIVFYGIILYVAQTEPNWNIFAAFGGIATFRIVMIPTTLIFAKKGDEEDNEL